MPGAACLWQPLYVLIYIGIGKASSRLGAAGCLGPIISLYMCIHKVEASGRSGVVCLGQPQYLSIYVQTYIRNGKKSACLGRPAWGDLGMPICTIGALNWDSKQPAWGRLPKQSPSSLHTCTYIRSGIWVSLLGAACPRASPISKFVHTYI